MHAAILLLVACASNFLVWASPAAVMEPRAPVGSQQHPREESHHSLETVRVGHDHPPHELSKRWVTATERRVLTISIGPAWAAALQIAATYTFPFQYFLDSDLNAIVYNHDNTQFTMSWPPSLTIEVFPTGRDIVIPAIITAVASPVSSIVCTLIWGTRMRTDWNFLIGMGLFELSVVSTAGNMVRIAPWMYSWRFDTALPP